MYFTNNQGHIVTDIRINTSVIIDYRSAFDRQMMFLETFRTAEQQLGKLLKGACKTCYNTGELSNGMKCLERSPFIESVVLLATLFLPLRRVHWVVLREFSISRPSRHKYVAICGASLNFLRHLIRINQHLF